MRKVISTIAALAFIGLCGGATDTSAANPTPDEQVQAQLYKRLEAAGMPPALTVAGAALSRPDLLLPFYAQRLYRPAWSTTRGLLPRVEALIKALREVEDDGLRPDLYQGALIASLIAERRDHDAKTPSTPVRLAELDLLLTDALLTAGTHLAGIRQTGQGANADTDVQQSDADLVRLLQGAVDTDRIADTLDSLRPPQAGYARLRQALRQYRSMAADGGWPLIPEGATLRHGDHDPRVTLLRARLQASGEIEAAAENDSPPLSTPDPLLFDTILEQAVRAFQARHGLLVDGVVGAATLQALNVPVEQRLDQITLNLTRWREQRRGNESRYILVNIPAFVLEVRENDHAVMTMRVVVGKEEHPTPAFSGTMTHLVLNPYWQVPPSIARREILPRLRRDPSYLTTQRLRILQGCGPEAREVDPATINWSQARGATWRYRFRQDPGPANALGRVKFIFPNHYDVYLHDTPARSLFVNTVRAFSHGCIRLETPIALATYLLRSQSRWDEQRILATVASGVEYQVRLPQPIPVHLVYRTAWVGVDGTVQFRTDIYGYDQPQGKALCTSVAEGCG